MESPDKLQVQMKSLPLIKTLLLRLNLLKSKKERKLIYLKIKKIFSFISIFIKIYATFKLIMSFIKSIHIR